MLLVVKLRSDVFLSVSQRISLDGEGVPVTTETEIDDSAWERSVAVGHAGRLLNSQFFSHLQAFFGNNSLYTLEDDKFLV